MNFTKKIFGAAALALALCACGTIVPALATAEDDQVGVAESGATLDFSLFDVPDGKDAAFYQERLQEIGAMMNGVKSTEEEIEKLNEVIPGAYLVIFKNLGTSDEVDESERNYYWQLYVVVLVREGKNEELFALLDAEKAKVEPDERRVGMLEVVVLNVKITKAGEAGDAAALKAAADELVEKAMKIDAIASESQELAEMIGVYDEELGAAAFKQIAELFAKSDDPMRKQLAKVYAGKERFNNLVGNEMLVEGLFLDGTEIKWEEYRGKVVLIDFWATWCGPCLVEIPNVRKLYEKYHDAGFDVISYSVDEDLEALEEFEKEEKLPWKTASEIKSVEKKNDKGEPVYKSVSDYYGVDTIPTMVLVGKDGKVIDTEARGERLEELLEELFPEVK